MNWMKDTQIVDNKHRIISNMTGEYWYVIFQLCVFSGL